MKAEHPFVDKVFNYDLTKLKKKKKIKQYSGSWSSCKIVQSIFCKNSVHKTHSNVAFKV